MTKLFAHLLETDALPWSVLGAIRITEEDTTSSSRIFIKILFQDMAEELGLVTLNKRLQDPDAVGAGWFDGIFPKDLPKNTRFSINFFTSIGLGGLTDDMREHLKNLPKIIMEQKAQEEARAQEAREARARQKQKDKGKGTGQGDGSQSNSYSYSSGSYSYSYSYSGSYSYSYSDEEDGPQSTREGRKG